MADEAIVEDGPHELTQWLGRSMRELLEDDHDSARQGVYLCSADAGVKVSIDFWRDALRDGPAFANPREFPWTLANSLATQAAAAANLHGPNYTLVGNAEALAAALSQAQDDLSGNLVDYAFVVAVDFHARAAAVIALGSVVKRGTAELVNDPDGAVTADLRSAAIQLRELCHAVERGSLPARFGVANEGCTIIDVPESD